MAAYTPTAEIVDRLKVIRPIKEPIDSCRPALFFCGGDTFRFPTLLYFPASNQSEAHFEILAGAFDRLC